MLSNIYKCYCKLIGAADLFGRTVDNAQLTGQESAYLLRDKIKEGKPLMVSRFGSTELNCLLNFYFIKQGLVSNVKNLLSGIPYFLKFNPNITRNLQVLSGFFPVSDALVTRYCEMSLQDLPEIDILGSWLSHEKYLYGLFNPGHVRIRLGDITPVKYPDPWTVALEGKKVLVVHPFTDTIQSQFEKRKLLFNDKRLLPDFELTTVKAVQSIAGVSTEFGDWFEALDFMKEKIASSDFDIALLGCGAYGMPLAAHVKRMGKQAIHIGGELQIMFGIKGKRWEDSNYNYHNRFYNEYWVRPSLHELPENANRVEGGCYW